MGAAVLDRKAVVDLVNDFIGLHRDFIGSGLLSCHLAFSDYSFVWNDMKVDTIARNRRVYLVVIWPFLTIALFGMT